MSQRRSLHSVAKILLDSGAIIVTIKLAGSESSRLLRLEPFTAKVIVENIIN